MTHELFLSLLSIGKYILATGALLLFYRSIFKQRASYTESRVFLLSVAFIALLVSQFRIEVTHPEPTLVEVESAVGPTLEVAGVTFPVRSIEPLIRQKPTLSSQSPNRLPNQLLNQPTATPIDRTQEPRLTDINPSSTKHSSTNPETTPAETPFNYLLNHPAIILLMVYVLVVLVLAFNLLQQYHRIRTLRRKGSVSLREGYELVEHADVSTPFSFAKTIFLPANLNEAQREVVLAHECWHIKHKHYVDVLLQEVLSCLFWFNPVQWLLRTDLRSVHEFQADRSVLNEGCDLYRYQTIILEEVMGNHFRLANGFNQSFTKKRFIQMKTPEPIRRSPLRTVLLVPFLMLLFVTLSLVPGKSEVIKVQKSTTTKTNPDGSTVTMTTSFQQDSAFSMTSNPLQYDPSNIQQSFTKSLDTLQEMMDNTLPILHKLARSTDSAHDAANFDALLKAMNMQVNGMGIHYKNLSQEVRNSFTQQDYRELETVMSNVKDTIRLLRTKRVDSFDSPYVMYPVTMMQQVFSTSFINKIVPEMFRLLSVSMGQMMGALANNTSDDASDDTSDDSSDDSVDSAENTGNEFGTAMGEFGAAFGEIGKALGEVMSQFGTMVGQQTMSTVETPTEEVETEEVDVEEVDTEEVSVDQVAGSTDIVTSEEALPDETALNNTNVGIRLTAINKITDPDVLGTIAMTDKDLIVRLEALKKVTDQDVLGTVAMNDKDKTVREMALNKVTDQDVLGTVAMNDKDLNVRLAALKKVTDQDVLGTVAMNDKDKTVREMALNKVTDQDVLGTVAMNDKDAGIRLYAVRKVTDQDVLATVAMNDKDSNVRMAAINKITDPDILATIATNDTNSGVRKTAKNRLK